MANDVPVFHWFDYLVFAASLAIGAVIGLYYACTGSKQKTVEDFLMGGRQLGVVPIALSIQATFTSAIIILGGTAEVYSHGTMMFTWWMVADIITVPLLVIIFIPFMRHNPLAISGYEVRYYGAICRYTCDVIIGLAITSLFIMQSNVVYVRAFFITTKPQITHCICFINKLTTINNNQLSECDLLCLVS